MRSNAYPALVSTSSESPGRSLRGRRSSSVESYTPSGRSGATNGSASQTMRSSSAWPTTRARCPSARISRKVEISPTDSYVPASTTVKASLSRTVCPLRNDFTSMLGEHVSRILRPEVKTSMVSSSWVNNSARWPLGGCPSRSTSSRSASSCWRASLRVSISLELRDASESIRASSWCTSRGLRAALCDPAALSSCSRRIAASRRSSSNSAASSLERSGSRGLPNASRSNSPMVRSFPAPGRWCGGYLNATGDFQFMRELEMGHTGNSVNIMFSRLYREDLSDCENPSHRRGGGGGHRCCGRRCDVHCIRYRCVAPRSAGSLQRAVAAGPAGAGGSRPAHPLSAHHRAEYVAGPERVVRQQGRPHRGRHPGSGHPGRPRTAEARCQGHPAADVQHQQHRPRRSRCRHGHHHGDGPASRPDTRVPQVRRSRRLEAVARLGDDADPVCALVALTAAECADALPQS